MSLQIGLMYELDGTRVRFVGYEDECHSDPDPRFGVLLLIDESGKDRSISQSEAGKLKPVVTEVSA